MDQNIFTKSVCRVCLDSNVAMSCIADDTELRETYEKLANTKLNIGDGRPETLCYFCYSQLKKNCTFSKLAKQSNEILINLVNKGFQITNETVDKLNFDNGMQKKFSKIVLSPTVLPSSPQLSVIHFANKKNSLNNDEVATNNHHDKTKLNGDFEKNNVIETKLDQANENNNKQPKQNTYICNECDVTFTNKKIFSSHLQLHKPKKSFHCDKCLKTFTKSRAFKQHMSRHRLARTHLCNLCDKAFCINASLVRHMKTHTGEKPYSCDSCGKTFRQKIHLSRHMGIQTGEKNPRKKSSKCTSSTSTIQDTSLKCNM